MASVPMIPGPGDTTANAKATALAISAIKSALDRAPDPSIVPDMLLSQFNDFEIEFRAWARENAGWFARGMYDTYAASQAYLDQARAWADAFRGVGIGIGPLPGPRRFPWVGVGLTVGIAGLVFLGLGVWGGRRK